MLKSDKWIRRMCLERQMIVPFTERTEGDGRISFGLSSYGYDIRLSDEYKVFAGAPGAVLDPKAFDRAACAEHKGPFCLIPPNSFALGRSLERFSIPRSVLCLCLGKSTYARCGIIVNVTPLEPGWTGHLTMEISNTAPVPAKVYSGEGIAQLVFLEADEACETSYADRRGLYQAQEGIVLPRVRPEGP